MEDVSVEEDASGGRGGSSPPDPLGGGSGSRVEAWSFAGVRRRGRNLAGDAVAALQARRPKSGLACPSPLRGEFNGILLT